MLCSRDPEKKQRRKRRAKSRSSRRRRTASSSSSSSTLSSFINTSMAGFLRRMLFFISQSSSSSAAHHIEQHRHSSEEAASALSPCNDRVSPDMLRAIFSLLSPKDLVSASLACKAWNIAARDERLWKNFLLADFKRLWPSVLFVETFLSAGPSIRSSVPVCAPFHEIYSKRRLNPCSVIIDGGSGYCKFGWSDSDEPVGRSPTFLEFGNIESPSYTLLKDFYSTIYMRLQAKPSAQPVVISTPLCYPDNTEIAIETRQRLREITYSALFDLGVTAVCAVDQAVLALYGAKQVSGIVVNIGFQVTSVVPILRGRVMRDIGVEVVGQGALQLTGYLSELMQQSGILFTDIKTVKALKENLCYVAQDYEAELRKNTEGSCTIENLGHFTLNQERFKASEILFQPKLGGLQTMGVHQAVALCITHCAEFSAGDSKWYKTIILTGGSACLPGLAERLKKELSKVVPHSLFEGLNVMPPPEGSNSVWVAAKLLSNLSTFQSAWCLTRKDCKRMGMRVVHERAFDIKQSKDSG